MPIRLSPRNARLKPSASIAARNKVIELVAAGRSIVDFTIGEPDLDTPLHIVEAAITALGKADTHYTASAGTPVLREAVCARMARDKGLTYSPANVVVGCGAKQLIFEAFAVTLAAGDEVVIPAPYWVSYPDMVAVNDGAPVIVPCGEDVGFKLTPAALEGALTARTRWVVLNSPNNPTGAVYSRSELAALAAVLARHPDVWVMTDDIYEHLLYDSQRHVNPVEVEPALAERTLIVSGLSKSYAMTGWRIGYALGPTDLVAAMVKLIGQSTTCASSIGQAAAVAALTGDQTCVAEAADIYRRRRARMISLLADIPGLRIVPPQGAFYLYPCIDGIIGRTTPAGDRLRSDLDVSLYLLDAGVAVLDGAAYGLSPYLRLSFATSLEAIEQGCERIRQAVAALH
jgi:aspartate aminotransferase